MSGMGWYVLIEIALRDRVPQERPVTIPRYMRQSPVDPPINHEARINHLIPVHQSDKRDK
jgi:hypothetical protein